MTCPKCGSSKTRVAEPFYNDVDYVFRRRKCSDCGNSFRTVEMTIQDDSKLNYRYSDAYMKRRGKTND